MKLQNKKMQKYKSENHQKLIILKGFMENGLQIRNQRVFLHSICQNRFSTFFEVCEVSIFKTLKTM